MVFSLCANDCVCKTVICLSGGMSRRSKEVPFYFVKYSDFRGLCMALVGVVSVRAVCAHCACVQTAWRSGVRRRPRNGTSVTLISLCGLRHALRARSPASAYLPPSPFPRLPRVTPPLLSSSTRPSPRPPRRPPPTPSAGAAAVRAAPWRAWRRRRAPRRAAAYANRRAAGRRCRAPPRPPSRASRPRGHLGRRWGEG